MRARVKISPREKRRHAWADFHARSRFACFTILEEKWGTTRSLRLPALAGILQVVKTSQVTSVQVVKMTVTTIACTEQWLFFSLFFRASGGKREASMLCKTHPTGENTNIWSLPVRERSLMFVFFTPESNKPVLFFCLYFFAFYFSFPGTQLSSKEFPH